VSVAADVQRGKQNIALDLKSEAGQQRLCKLIAEADVVVRNMRPEAAKRLGVDADSIHAIRPEAIYCTISAYPRSDWPGYDPLLQIGSGIVEAYAEDSRSGFRNWLGVGRFGAIRYQPGPSREGSRAIRGTGRHQPGPIRPVHSTRSHRHRSRAPARSRITDAPDTKR
jgi:hypothetical protein